MSRDIIKLDQIDVTFHQKKRTITAVKDVTIHIQEGYLRNRWIFWSREINPCTGD
ncbi:methionine ABC superfamily ATP binding cassette transporter, ABC protein [Streptococcus pneumoniae GA60132]|nr:methionine ABC superfamily ATP binding cassette transporter, ABC protein [Streptococcus pneumoniae GA60132]